MTKTEKLRAALISRGFVPVEHASRRECLKGKSTQGADLWVWPDKTGGARWAKEPKITFARPMSAATIKLLMEGLPSAVFGQVGQV